MIDDKMLQYLFINICETIQREQRYRSFRHKNHICILFDKKKIYSIGVNYSVQNGSIHSEMDAFNRIEFNSKKSPKKLNMLIVRVCYEHESERKRKNYQYKQNNKYTEVHQHNCNCENISSSSDNSDISDNTETSSDDESLLPDLTRLHNININKIININYLIEQIRKSNTMFNGIRFRLSKPCYHCIQHIKQSCLYKNYIVKKIYYTIDVNYIYETNLDEVSIYPHVSSYYKMLNHEIFWNTLNTFNTQKLRNRFYK